MKRKSIILLVLIAVLLAVGIPIAMDWLIIGNNIQSNITNTEWVSFFGSYLGAILGAVVSLVGIIITIRYTKDENKKEHELQVRPYCTIRFVAGKERFDCKQVLEGLELGFEGQRKDMLPYTGILYIRNIGLGPAIEFNFLHELSDTGREQCVFTSNTDIKGENIASKTLQPNEEGAFPVYIWFNFDPIKEEDLIPDDFFGSAPSYDIRNKYKSFTIRIKLFYCDLFRNEYCQEVLLRASSMPERFENGHWQHVGRLDLIKSAPPERNKTDSPVIGLVQEKKQTITHRITVTTERPDTDKMH